MNNYFYKKNFARLSEKQKINYCIDTIMETHLKINELEIQKKTGSRVNINTNPLTRNIFVDPPPKRNQNTSLDINLDVDNWYDCKPCKKLMESSNLNDREISYYGNTYFKKESQQYQQQPKFSIYSPRMQHQSSVPSSFKSLNMEPIDDIEQSSDLLYNSFSRSSSSSSSSSDNKSLSSSRNDMQKTIVYFDVGKSYFGRFNNDLVCSSPKIKSRASSVICKEICKLIRLGINVYIFIPHDAFDNNKDPSDDISIMRKVIDIAKKTFSKSKNVKFYESTSSFTGHSRSEINYIFNENVAYFSRNLLISHHKPTLEVFSNRNKLRGNKEFTSFTSIKSCIKYVSTITTKN